MSARVKHQVFAFHYGDPSELQRSLKVELDTWSNNGYGLVSFQILAGGFCIGVVTRPIVYELNPPADTNDMDLPYREDKI